MLLLHVRGATSFENLRTVQGVMYETFEEAAKAMHLVDDDQEWARCMDEAVLTELPKQVRLLFATICANCGPMNPVSLWERFREDMAEDVRFRFPDMTDDECLNIALFEINQLLHSMGTSLDKFNIPLPTTPTNA
jgi:hypothetical protein